MYIRGHVHVQQMHQHTCLPCRSLCDRLVLVCRYQATHIVEVNQPDNSARNPSEAFEVGIGVGPMAILFRTLLSPFQIYPASDAATNAADTSVTSRKAEHTYSDILSGLLRTVSVSGVTRFLNEKLRQSYELFFRANPSETDQSIRYVVSHWVLERHARQPGPCPGKADR